MALVNPPVKPFPNYKWRWAVLTPTESLNDPPIFLGVLRVFSHFENLAPSSKEIMDGLAVVQAETNSPVDLVRTQDRNLIRNSGQYWKALGLLEEAHGLIHLTPFGKMLADSSITQVEFAATIIKTLELPNRRIEDPTEWDAVGLRIHPLELILDVLSDVANRYTNSQAFITPFELVKIIIPLAGGKPSIAIFGDALIQFRQGAIDISTWPDCAMSANDRRMAREFLLFLSNYGFCERKSDGRGNDNEIYNLAGISKEEIDELQAVQLAELELDKVVKQLRTTQIPGSVERKRVSREILDRPYQSIFRKDILDVYNSTCIITGVNIQNVLEAAHIVPVKENGSDKVDNGLCLRSDVHQLFDSGHLRILPDGNVVLSEAANAKENYYTLPRKIVLPEFVNPQNLDWRIKYY